MDTANLAGGQVGYFQMTSPAAAAMGLYGVGQPTVPLLQEWKGLKNAGLI